MRKPTTKFVISVCVRFKKVRDTIKECNRKGEPWGPYIHGQLPPHFPAPAIIVGAGYIPASTLQAYPSAYWYVGSARYMWSMYQKYGFTQERA